eukprot:CAMPEP_0170560834 /NCGR_PEP_ID=MMETSP0211-20121228/51275_1 /TAXON_ID=311385 /ORGANISM="Pseudokeronopsis sp., Strain OXSARD2" /LENGTH=50 /DNA_ID=CAMNT_0010875575 /DNA_START=46 /DNA_END=198 /DNA_ORIENTATION=+
MPPPQNNESNESGENEDFIKFQEMLKEKQLAIERKKQEKEREEQEEKERK